MSCMPYPFTKVACEAFAPWLVLATTIHVSIIHYYLSGPSSSPLLLPSLQARPLSEIGVEPTTLIFDHTHAFGSWHFADH